MSGGSRATRLLQGFASISNFLLREKDYMIGWALSFLILALITAFLGFTGIAEMSMEIAWILLVVGLIVFVVSFIFGRRRPVV